MKIIRPGAARKYTRIAGRYDLFAYPLERMLFKKLRAEAIIHAHGTTLEVGVGTGRNLPYYQPTVDLSAVDFSSGMLKIAKNKGKKIQLQALQFYEMDIENLAFGNNAFDTVVSTFVFCTVPDPMAGLREVYRVIRPGGKAIFLEHMKSRYAIVNVLLYMMNIFSVRLLGTSMTRETQANIEMAGFVLDATDNKLLDVVRLIIAHKV
jgi:ubiquinone/menaquinone biosynthesis C-methylase UbiE